MARSKQSEPISEPSDQAGDDSGLSTDTDFPTNLLIADIVLRGAGKTMRDTLEKRSLVAGYNPAKAREMSDGHTVLASLAVYGASRVAARSGVGLALVAGGLVLKTLYDRGKAIQLARGADEDAAD
ncbi:MAG: hypothetical protein AAF687_08935 [Pseudomonadota bacterium]